MQRHSPATPVSLLCSSLLTRVQTGHLWGSCNLQQQQQQQQPLKLLGQDRVPAMVHPASSAATLTLVRTVLHA
jgi:hypothetical protein